MTLEEYLILKAERSTILSTLIKVIGLSIVDNEPYLFYTYKGKEKKINLSSLKSIEHSYELQVWTDMLSQGYMLIYLDGGWLVKKDDCLYELSENTCTCKGSTYKPEIKCKHLIFRDAEIRYRSEQAIERSSFIKDPVID